LDPSGSRSGLSKKNQPAPALIIGDVILGHVTRGAVLPVLARRRNDSIVPERRLLDADLCGCRRAIS
jgi:hypothetical protein